MNRFVWCTVCEYMIDRKYQSAVSIDGGVSWMHWFREDGLFWIHYEVRHSTSISSPSDFCCGYHA